VWWNGWLGWTREDTETEDSSSEEIPPEKAVEDRKSDRRPEESRNWHWAKKETDEQKGPVSKSRLREMSNERDLDPEDLVWKEGMDDWKKAGSIEDLFSNPPPLPDSADDEKETVDGEPPLLNDDVAEKEKPDGNEYSSNSNEGEESTSRDDNPFWKRHPIWTGIAALFLIGMIGNAIERSDSTSKGESSSECMGMTGTHTGLYQGAGDAGRVRVEIESDCDYEVYMDGRKLAVGRFEKSGNTLTFENGNTAQYSGGTISWTEDTSMGMVVYEAN
jgi:hypothetical protein